MSDDTRPAIKERLSALQARQRRAERLRTIAIVHSRARRLLLRRHRRALHMTWIPARNRGHVALAAANDACFGACCTWPPAKASVKTGFLRGTQVLFRLEIAHQHGGAPMAQAALKDSDQPQAWHLTTSLAAAPSSEVGLMKRMLPPEGVADVLPAG
ncbi:MULTISPECIES: hypothetical protein [unclassified Streptosporangium]|uniref:hypothetical protein n=1 Tax=unclassified Streptosporangium TaxID=2632669 RepID=UPI002E2B457A|nr:MULTISPECIES: hypothetical protein [unclassified Streptosporangium]